MCIRIRLHISLCRYAPDALIMASVLVPVIETFRITLTMCTCESDISYKGHGRSYLTDLSPSTLHDSNITASYTPDPNHGHDASPSLNKSRLRLQQP